MCGSNIFSWGEKEGGKREVERGRERYFAIKEKCFIDVCRF